MCLTDPVLRRKTHTWVIPPFICLGERVKGIEPSCVAWEATVLPLNYTRGCVANGEPLRRLDSVRVTFLDRDASRTSGRLWAPREAHSPVCHPGLYDALPAGLLRPACAG